MNKKIYGYPAVGVSYCFMKELSFELDLKGWVYQEAVGGAEISSTESSMRGTDLV